MLLVKYGVQEILLHAPDVVKCKLVMMKLVNLVNLIPGAPCAAVSRGSKCVVCNV